MAWPCGWPSFISAEEFRHDGAREIEPPPAIVGYRPLRGIRARIQFGCDWFANPALAGFGLPAGPGGDRHRNRCVFDVRHPIRYSMPNLQAEVGSPVTGDRAYLGIRQKF